MIHVVAIKCLIGLPLIIHIELSWRSRSRSLKNRGVGVGFGVRGFVYRLHSPGYKYVWSLICCRLQLSLALCARGFHRNCCVCAQSRAVSWMWIFVPLLCLQRGSAAARLLGLRVRISPGALMSVACESCVLSGRGLGAGLINRPGESYWTWCVWVWSWSLDTEEVLAH
jgi:hypothetical protein